MNPSKILTEWNTEELLVAFGYYANQHAAESYEVRASDKKERAKLTPLDRYAVLFVSQEQMEEQALQHEKESQEVELKKLEDFGKISEMIFG